jgi:hypothetical protein
MADLPPELRAIADRAARSLAAWQVLEALADGPLPPTTLVATSGLDVDATERGVETLAAAGLVEDGPYAVRVVPALADGVRQLCARVHASRALRQEVLALAARRESAAGLISLTITWAPTAPRSLASNVPARPAPSRSGGPAAPAT